MMETLALAAVAAGLCLSGGYLVGVRRGMAAREALRRHLNGRHDELAALRTEAQGLRTEVQVGRLEIQDLRSELMGAQASAQGRTSEVPAFRAQIDDALRTLLGPLLERDAEARGLRETVQGLLGPMVERERLGLAISQLDRGLHSRGELPRLLTLIAERGGFATVLLSDAEGLPLASNDTREDPEQLAATTSLLLTLADRITQAGDPPPIAAVLRDEDNRVVLHRLFRVGDERYVLTAVTKGLFLPPDVLDPSLVQIERLLAVHALP